jgi:hypothetical protein
MELINKDHNTEKVFCIGCHKTGTASLYHFAIDHGYNAYHGLDWSKPTPNLDKLDLYNFFSDGGGHFWSKKSSYDIDNWGDNHNVSFLFYKYPNSKFILNDRNLEKWLISKLYHAGWRHTSIVLPDLEELNHKNWTHKSIGCVTGWIENRNKYYQKVYDFFERNHALDRLLRVDITEDQSALNQVKSFLQCEQIAVKNYWHNSSNISIEDEVFFKSIIRSAFSQLD